MYSFTEFQINILFTRQPDEFEISSSDPKDGRLLSYNQIPGNPFINIMDYL